MLLSEKVVFFLMASNCSFRITRTTEDLAETIIELSQRLVKLEQRFEALELQIMQNQSEIPVKEIEMLDGIDQQLQKCKALLETSSEQNLSEEVETVNDSSEKSESKQTEILNISLEEEDAEQIWIEENKNDSAAA